MAALSAWHEHHATAAEALEGVAALPAHVRLEAYSVLTRLPAGLAVDADTLGSALRWEPSRGGALFPHLYGPLPVASVLWVRALPLDASGRHVFPDLAD